MDTKILKQIGLTDSEVKVYLSLLELGSTTKGPIVEKSGVASSKIYELLDKLIVKGLVSSIIKSGVKYFESAPPSRLLDYMKEREADIKNQREKLEHLIPDLELRRSLAGFGSETQVFKGMRGAATSFDDILKELKRGDEYYVLGISKFTPHFERFVVHFHNKRAKLGIKSKIIVSELAQNIGNKLEELPHTKVKYLQKELFTPVVFIIYKNTTLISIGLDEVFIQIKSKNLTEGMKAYAKHMYSIGKKRTELP
tara:strand:- start:48 stop:809 length:762 start_codon:yes stop_codon:yes gene_type:complete